MVGGMFGICSLVRSLSPVDHLSSLSPSLGFCFFVAASLLSSSFACFVCWLKLVFIVCCSSCSTMESIHHNCLTVSSIPGQTLIWYCSLVRSLVHTLHSWCNINQPSCVHWSSTYSLGLVWNYYFHLACSTHSLIHSLDGSSTRLMKTSIVSQSV